MVTENCEDYSAEQPLTLLATKRLHNTENNSRVFLGSHNNV